MRGGNEIENHRPESRRSYENAPDEPQGCCSAHPKVRRPHDNGRQRAVQQVDKEPATTAKGYS